MNLRLPFMKRTCDNGLCLNLFVFVIDEKILHYIFRHYDEIQFETFMSGAFQMRMSH
jgi:hypothetical protein